MSLKIVDDLRALAEHLQANAAEKLDEVERENPGLGEIEILGIYENEIRAALPTVDPVVIAFGVKRAIEQIKTGRTGSNPRHAGGG